MTQDIVISVEIKEGGSLMAIAGAPAWLSVGWILALIVFILVIVFAALGQLDYKLAGALGGLALARLIP